MGITHRHDAEGRESQNMRNTSNTGTEERHIRYARFIASAALATGMALGIDAAIPLPYAYADEEAEAQAAVDAATAARDDVLSRIDQCQRDLDAAALAVPVARNELSVCVRDTYKMQQDLTPLGFMDALLDCDSIDEMVSLTKARDSIQGMSAQKIRALNESYVALGTSKAALDQELANADMTLGEANAALEQKQEEARERERAAEAARQAAASSSRSSSSSSDGDSPNVELAAFKQMGVIYQNGYRYTYYSEQVLPGGGLSIPGRHHEDGFVVDGDGYICVASNDHSYGTVVPVPFNGRMGKVYDSGCASGTLDIYIA